MSLSTCTGDGEIVYFFFKKKQNAPSTATFPDFYSSVIQLQDTNHQPLPYVEVLPENQPSHLLIEYMIGDVDGDGEVTAYDATALLVVINSTNTTLTAANAQAYFDSVQQSSGTVLDGMYLQNTFVFDVADVNLDGVLDSDDTGMILYYYSLIVAGYEPDDDPSVAHLGTTGYYVA